VRISNGQDKSGSFIAVSAEHGRARESAAQANEVTLARTRLSRSCGSSCHSGTLTLSFVGLLAYLTKSSRLTPSCEKLRRDVLLNRLIGLVHETSNGRGLFASRPPLGSCFRVAERDSGARVLSPTQQGTRWGKPGVAVAQSRQPVGRASFVVKSTKPSPWEMALM
jgi:hypothetical protein